MSKRYYPVYDKDTDYNTNAPSFYEFLAKVNEQLKLSLKRLDEYDKTMQDKLLEINDRLDYYMNEWEKNLEEFPNEVMILLQEWLDTGVLDTVINETIFNDLNTEINNIVSELEQTEELVGDNSRGLEYFWNAPEQPPARTDQPNHFIDAFNVTADEIITNYMEPIRLSDTNYITRENMGKDESGTYDIFRYKFTPRNYKKTVILDTAMHGGEITMVLIMLRFLHHLTNDWEKYPELAEIRQNVRIIYTPLVNPWGFDDRLNKNTVANGRRNSNGVDINRNFSYLFENASDDPSAIDYRGTNPFSEKESQYVKQTLEDYKSAVGYISLHNTGTPSYDVYIPYAKNMNGAFFSDLIEYWTKDITNPKLNVFETDKSSSPNYAFNELGVRGVGTEWSDKRTGGGLFSSKDITDGLTWVTNFIVETCKIETDNHFVKETYYRSSTGNEITITNSGYWNGATDLKDLIYIPDNGVLTTHTTLKIKADTEGTLQICPMLGQGGNGTGLLYDDKQLGRWDEILHFKAGEEKTYSFCVSIPVRATTISGAVTRAGSGVNFFATDSNFDILSYNSNAIYQQSTTEKNVFSKEV